MNDFLKSGVELSSKIVKISSEYREVLDEVQKAKKEKAQAKNRYSQCIDEGSEAGLKDCLRTIRVCNETIESLPASREEFYGKISELEKQHKDLMKAAQQNIDAVQAALDQAAKDMKKAEEKSDNIYRILSEITGLKTLILESGDVDSPTDVIPFS